jgi:hypothetical protein
MALDIGIQSKKHFSNKKNSRITAFIIIDETAAVQIGDTDAWLALGCGRTNSSQDS